MSEPDDRLDSLLAGGRRASPRGALAHSDAYFTGDTARNDFGVRIRSTSRVRLAIAAVGWVTGLAKDLGVGVPPSTELTGPEDELIIFERGTRAPVWQRRESELEKGGDLMQLRRAVEHDLAELTGAEFAEKWRLKRPLQGDALT